MAEHLQTLKPLTREQKTALDPRTDEDVLHEARVRFQEASDWENAEREQQYEAQRFASGHHWPEFMRQQRSLPGQEQPCLVIDRLAQYQNQILNSYRRNPLGIRVRPKDTSATPQLATILEGQLRSIEAESQAEIAYTTALSQAISTGEGFFRLTLGYENEYSFTQKLTITPLYNRFAVYCDPASVHPAGLDLDYAFIVSTMTHAAFCAKYQKQPVDVGQWALYPQQDWVTKDQVRVADYYYKVWERKTLFQMPDGTVLEKMEGVEVPEGWPTRETLCPKVYGVTMCGYAILAKTTWPGQHIPLIRVEGRRMDLDGKTQRTGIVQASSSSQLAYDAYRSAEMAAIALVPKAPYVLYVEQISGYEHLWNQANDGHVPYLPIKAVSAGGTLLPPPRREVAEPAVQAITQAAMMAAQDIQATVGQYEASVGAPSNEQSGAAIDSRKREGEQSTAGFTANLAWSIEACGRQILDILPRLYPGATDLRQVGKDGNVSMAPVNQRLPDGTPDPQGQQLGQGRYECVVSAGPSYDTSREMMNERLGILLGSVPQVAPYVLDLYTGSLDIPQAEELAARLKTMVPPEALAATEGQGNPQTQLVQAQNEARQAQQQLQALTQQMQQMQQQTQVATQQLMLVEQENARLKTQASDKSRDIAIDTQKAKWDFQVSTEANAIKMRELELKYNLQAAELAHTINTTPQNGQESSDD
jgi:Phage P22-like portal protein